MAITHKIEEITPTKAKKFLDNNPGNRKIMRARVELYKRQMLEGKWEVTGEAIQIALDDSLINGQHRLTACVEADVPFKTLVVRGLPPEVKAKVDTGATRTAAHVLYMHGMQYVHEVPSTIRALHKIRFAEENGKWPSPNAHIYVPLTNAEILEEAQDEAFAESVKAIKNSEGRTFLRPCGAFAAVYFHLHENNAKRAEEFFEALAMGVGLERDSPILRLRNLLIRSVGTKANRRPMQWKVAVTLKTWNLWLNNYKATTLSFRDDEAWPQITKRYKPRHRKRKSS